MDSFSELTKEQKEDSKLLIARVEDKLKFRN